MVCKGCFGEKEPDVPCPHCGYREGEPGKDAEAAAPGTVLGRRYLLGNVVYANANCLTYKGYDRTLDAVVFICQKREHLPESEFLQKARWLVYFRDNPNIINLYNYEKISGKCFMIFQYIELSSATVPSLHDVKTDTISVHENDVVTDRNGEFYIMDFDISIPYRRQEPKNSQDTQYDLGEEKDIFLPCGTVLKERYEILNPLGRGGFGVAYLVYDQWLDRLAALKEYMPAGWVERDTQTACVEAVSAAVLEGYKKGLANFRQEAAYMARLNENSGVASVYDFFYENETAYLVMEYVEGENVGKLGKLIGGFSYDAAKDIFIKVLETLVDIHKKGLVHEDISPGNIILTKKNEVKLIDFGSAHLVGRGISSIAEMMIKPGYAAIEQYDEEYAADVRTDIYQAAATFYMMITGEKPEEASERFRRDQLALPSELGVELPEEDEAALMKALEILPENRYASAEGFLAEIKKPNRGGKEDE